MHIFFYFQRLMGAWKISFASEAKERALAKVLVGPNLYSEAVPFAFPNSCGGERIQKDPMAFVPNLVAKLLDQNDQ